MTEFAGTTRFRLFIDDDRAEPFVLITEPYGREIPLDPGTWVDVEVNNGDGTPAEVWVRPDGTIAVHGREVNVTDESGEERQH